MSCGCNNITIVPNAPCTDCLIVRSAIIPCTDDVMPCGGSFAVDITDLINDTVCGAGGSTIAVELFDTTYLTNVVLTGMIITGDTVGTPPVNYLPWVVFRVECVNEINSARGKISVCVDNPCSRVICPVTHTCNPCTGICEVGTVDLETNGQFPGNFHYGGLQIG